MFCNPQSFNKYLPVQPCDWELSLVSHFFFVRVHSRVAINDHYQLSSTSVTLAKVRSLILLDSMLISVKNFRKKMGISAEVGSRWWQSNVLHDKQLFLKHFYSTQKTVPVKSAMLYFVIITLHTKYWTAEVNFKSCQGDRILTEWLIVEPVGHRSRSPINVD